MEAQARKRTKAMANHLSIAAMGLACAACTPAPGGTNTGAERPDTVQDASVADAGAPDAADAGESVLAQWSRRAWSIHRGSVVYEAHGNTTCPPLPEARPSDLVLVLIRRGGEGGDWTYFGVTDTSPCRFSWSMPWMSPPPAACEIVSKSRIDQIYADLRRLSIATIRTRTLKDFSPHRGGYAIAYRYGDVECEANDILDSEVLAEDQGRFDAALDLVRAVYREAADGG